MKLILIRHLPTPGNEKRQYIGRTDESLSEAAVETFLCQHRTYPEAERILASPMKRCVETARLIYPGVQAEMEAELRECDFGEFEGKCYEQLKDEPAYREWLDSGGRTAFPGGESQEEFRERCVRGMKKQIRRLLKEEVHSAAFLVHGGTIMAVMEQLAEERKEFYCWQVKNGDGFIAEVHEHEWADGQEVLRHVQRLEQCEMKPEQALDHGRNR